MPERIQREALLARVGLLRPPPGRATVLVAIAGRGGAGKSSLAEAIAERLPGTQIVHVDDFAGPGDGAENRARLRRQVLEPLAANRPGRYQRWDWDHKRLAEWHTVEPQGIVIVEGVMATAPDVWDVWDCMIWVEAPKEVRIARGVERDGEHMRSTWLEVWEPEEDAYIARERPEARADFIVNGIEPLQ